MRSLALSLVLALFATPAFATDTKIKNFFNLPGKDLDNFYVAVIFEYDDTNGLAVDTGTEACAASGYTTCVDVLKLGTFAAPSLAASACATDEVDGTIGIAFCQ